MSQFAVFKTCQTPLRFGLPSAVFSDSELADAWVRIRPANLSSAFHIRFSDHTPKRFFDARGIGANETTHPKLIRLARLRGRSNSSSGSSAPFTSESMNARRNPPPPSRTQPCAPWRGPKRRASAALFSRTFRRPTLPARKTHVLIGGTE